MDEENKEKYWLVTIAKTDGSAFHTFAVSDSPVDWLLSSGRGKWMLVNQLQITEKQYFDLRNSEYD
jgi:hypothetical protein